MNSYLRKNYLDIKISEVINLDNKTLEKINFIINNYLKKLTNNNIDENTNEILKCITVISEIYDYLPEKDKWDEYLYILMNKLKNQMTNGIYINQLYMYGGLSDVGLTIYLLNKNTGNYSKFLNTINSLIIESLPKMLDEFNKSINNITMLHYDIVSGISGIVRYLLNFAYQPQVLKIIKDSLTYLIKITKNITINGYEVPGWYISGKNQYRDDEKETYKNGNFNYGLSHGVAGILGILSLCYKQNVIVIGQKEAIEKIVNQYEHLNVFNGENIPFWPGQYSFEDYIKNNLDMSMVVHRMSWCYGSIGILRALKLSAIALNNQSLKEWVSNKIHLISKMDIQDYDLESPTLCHGYSGLMLSLITEYKETRNPDLLPGINNLLQKVLDSYEKDSSYGFINIDKFMKNGKLIIQKTDDNSFLTGSSGVILALISTFKRVVYFDEQLLLN